jgi:hypothetical protein
LSQKNHFWVGSDCGELLLLEPPRHAYPTQVSSASDIITITSDLGKNFPDSSWMLYLFEFFIDRSKQVPLELDLTCAFDDDGLFIAIFNGCNQYEFKTMKPAVGHSYVREITVDALDRVINYELTDLNIGQLETFKLTSNNLKADQPNDETELKETFDQMEFQGSDHFTGIEWWNMARNGDPSPYPIRYQATVSLLQYGQHNERTDSGFPISYQPYTSLIPNQDQNSKPYPISFQSTGIVKGCICYNVTSGNCNQGMTYRPGWRPPT